jgi:hypothetical protein
MTTTFLGNISDVFDCEKLISQAIQHQGETHTGHIPLPTDHPEYENFIIQDKLSKQAGYDVNGAMEFRHFKPAKHFDNEFVDIFADYVKATPLVVFVSEIKPGRMAPWHFDIDPNEQENKKKGNLIRFHLHLSKPENGHVFIVGKEIFYNVPQGSVYQWNDLSAWHAGTNCGIVPKYLFSFKGYQ